MSSEETNSIKNIESCIFQLAQLDCKICQPDPGVAELVHIVSSTSFVEELYHSLEGIADVCSCKIVVVSKIVACSSQQIG
jgi:hypothetical protein